MCLSFKRLRKKRWGWRGGGGDGGANRLRRRVVEGRAALGKLQLSGEGSSFSFLPFLSVVFLLNSSFRISKAIDIHDNQ